MIYDELTGLILKALIAINPEATATDLAKYLKDGVLPI